ncbi:MAG: protein kinase domain-containing protein, partial [Acidimicrobiales bacterium]
ALHYAHRRGVLHRDIKPENLLFAGDRSLVKVTDFGIAKVLVGATPALTRTGEIIGTPAYMAPEQVGAGELSPATDVYATGAMLYELLTDRLPFPKDDELHAVLYRRVHEEPRPFLDSDGVPKALAATVRRAMARQPADRYPSAQDMGVAVARAAASAWGPGWLTDSGICVQADAILARAGPAPDTLVPAVVGASPPPGPARRRHARSVVAAAAVLTLVLAVAAGLLVTRRGEDEGCLAGIFEEIPGNNVATVEAGIICFDLPGPRAAGDLSFGLELTDGAETVGGLRVDYVDVGERFRIDRAVDARCREIGDVANTTRGGDGRTLEKLDVVRIGLPAGSYLLRFGTSDRISVDYIRAPASRPSSTTSSSPATAVTTSTTPGTPPKAAPPTTTTTTPPTPAAAAPFMLNFDQGIGTDASGNRFVVDAAGTRIGYVTGPVPGQLSLITHGAGKAIKFPDPCPAAPGSTCPRVVVDIASEATLNPGTRDFEFGASVLVQPGEVGPGSNVVQKGFSVGVAPDPNQWKIEISGPDGQPRCVVVAKGTGTAYPVRAAVTVADGGWHTIDCVKTATSLSILVDGRNQGVIVLPAGVAIDNTNPVRLGGMGTGQNNDQYFGSLDDVYLALR